MGKLRRGAAAIGQSFVLVTRRARSDMLALIGIVMLIAVTSALAVAVPREIGATLDSAAREAVDAAGTEADLLLRSSIADRAGDNITTSERLLTFAEEVPDRLPAALSGAVKQVSTGILGPELDGAGPAGIVKVRIGVLDTSAAAALDTVAGEFPRPQADTADDGGAVSVDIVVSAAAAEAAVLKVGDVLTVGAASSAADIGLHVVGVVAADDESGQPWVDLPGMWNPRALTSHGSLSGATFTVLSDADGFDRVSTRFPNVSTGVIRTSFEPAYFDMRRYEAVREGIDELETSAASISQGAPLSVIATSGYEEALSGFPEAAAAANAQLSTLAAGLLGVAALVTVLAGAALAGRRRAEIALLRSRGASLVVIGVHAVVESVIVTVIGVGLGVTVAMILGGPVGSLSLLLGVTALAVVVPVASTLRHAVATRSSSRTRVLVVAGAAALVATAVTSVIALRSGTRGVGNSIDPLALGAPVLCAAVVALCLSPLPATLGHPASRLASRRRGPGALLAASSARGGRAVVTLVALILASSVAITSLVLLQTVASGQEAAAWRAVGGDVRIDEATDAAALVSELESAGATAAAIAQLDDVKVQGSGSSFAATVLAVDDDYSELLSTLPSASPESADADDVRKLGEEGVASATEAVPALVDSRLADITNTESVTLDIGGALVPVTVVGASVAGPGYESGPFAIVDRSRLEAYLEAMPEGQGPSEATADGVPANTVLAVGAGANAVVADGSVTGVVVSREAVLEVQRHGALISGITSATANGLVGTALLAALALLLTAVLGARRRGRTLALLGTLGLPRRAGIALAAGELVPLVVSGVVGGSIAAAVVIAAAGPAFGVDALAGGDAVITVPAWLAPAVLGVACAVLAAAVAVDAPLSRRVRTADILRTGEET